MSGRLILVHGASSAGKSTLCRAAQRELPAPFLFHSPDLFFGDALPPDWPVIRDRFFRGFHRSLAAFAEAEVDVIADYIIESSAMLDDLEAAVRGLDVLWVGLHTPIEELERRERERGDRTLGDARRDLETVHGFRRYDLELDGTRPPQENARQLAETWRLRQT